MKLPNGFGSVYKLSGNRRRPWIARKTINLNKETRKQEYYTVGYYKSRSEALEALVEYNKKPLGIKRDILWKDLYEKWSKSRYPKLAAKTKETYITAWGHLSKIEGMMVRDVKMSHLQEIIDDMSDPEDGKTPLGYSSCHKVKVLAGILMKFAMADDIITLL